MWLTDMPYSIVVSVFAIIILSIIGSLFNVRPLPILRNRIVVLSHSSRVHRCMQQMLTLLPVEKSPLHGWVNRRCRGRHRRCGLHLQRCCCLRCTYHTTEPGLPKAGSHAGLKAKERVLMDNRPSSCSAAFRHFYTNVVRGTGRYH